MEHLEGHLNKLQRKFNLLSNWLQIKFHDDETFPKSLLEADLNDLDNLLYGYSKTKSDSETKGVRVSRRQRRDAEKSVPKEDELQHTGTVEQIEMKPCFISIERMVLKEDKYPSTCNSISTSDELFTSCEEFWPDALTYDADGSFEENKNFGPSFLQTVSGSNLVSSSEPSTSQVLSVADNESTNQPELETFYEDYRPRTRKQAPSANTACPFCRQLYAKGYLRTHILRYHSDKASKETFKDLKESLKVTRKSTSQNKVDQTETVDEVDQNEQTDLNSVSLGNSENESRLHVKRKQRKTIVPCPFCTNHYKRRNIFIHLRDDHADKVTAETLKKLKRSFRVRKYKKTEQIEPSCSSSMEHQGRKDLFLCEVCQQQLKTLRAYQIHAKVLHPAFFDEKVNSGEFFKESRPTEENAGTVKCGVCDRVVKRTYYEAHLRIVHGGSESHLCSTCGYKTTQKRLLRAHMEIHSTEKKLKCHLCPFAARQSQSIRIHFRRVHAPVQLSLQCSLCGDFFKGSSSLAQHISAVHKNRRPFPCKLCEKAFKTGTHLRRHLKTHDNPNSRKRGLNKDRDVIRRKSSLVCEKEPVVQTRAIVNTDSVQANIPFIS